MSRSWHRQPFAFSKLGELALLWREYKIARQEERAVLQLLEKAPTITHADLSGSKTTMSLVTDSEGFFTVNRRNRSPLLTGNPAPAPGGKVRGCVALGVTVALTPTYRLSTMTKVKRVPALTTLTTLKMKRPLG